MLFEDEVLSLGEKIDILCEKLDLKQKDLKGDFTRTNIYLAKKNGKCTHKIAEAIAEAFNKRIAEGNYNIEKITVEQLLLSEDAQANKKMKHYCDKIHEIAISSDPLEELEINMMTTDYLINKYNIEPELICKRYYYVSEAYFSAHKYHDCRSYALKTFMSAMASNNIVYILEGLNQFIKSLYWNCEYEDIEIYSEMARMIAEDRNIGMSDELKKIYYNTSLALSKQDEPDKCMEYLQQIDASTLPKEKCFDVMVLKSVCYRKMNKLNECEQILLSIINESRNNEALNPLALAYANLAFLEATKNDIEKCKQHINTATKIKSDDTYHTLILCDCFRSSLKINNEKYILDNYLIFIQYVVKLNQKKLIIEAIQEVFKYFVEHRNTNEIEKLLSIVSDIIIKGTNKIPCELCVIFVEAVNYFAYDKSMAIKYFDLCLKVQKKLCIP